VFARVDERLDQILLAVCKQDADPAQRRQTLGGIFQSFSKLRDAAAQIGAEHGGHILRQRHRAGEGFPRDGAERGHDASSVLHLFGGRQGRGFDLVGKFRDLFAGQARGVARGAQDGLQAVEGLFGLGGVFKGGFQAQRDDGQRSTDRKTNRPNGTQRRSQRAKIARQANDRAFDVIGGGIHRQQRFRGGLSGQLNFLERLLTRFADFP
jgi:hypothetical protein